MAKKYGVKLKHQKYEKLLTVINGERVNLTGKDYTYTTKETKDKSSEPVKFKGATQKHLKAYFEFPNQILIEEIEVSKKDNVEVK